VILGADRVIDPAVGKLESRVRDRARLVRPECPHVRTCIERLPAQELEIDGLEVLPQITHDVQPVAVRPAPYQCAESILRDAQPGLTLSDVVFELECRQLRPGQLYLR